MIYVCIPYAIIYCMYVDFMENKDMNLETVANNVGIAMQLILKEAIHFVKCIYIAMHSYAW